MSVPLPEGEALRRAIRWISGQQEIIPKPSIISLVEEAGKKFNLSPKDCDFLLRFLTDSKDPLK
jgi:hypothetical protein